MNMGLIYYVQTNGVSIAILLYLFFAGRVNRKIKTSEDRIYGNLIFSTIVYCLADIICWYADGKTFAGARFWVYFGNITYVLFAPVMSYLWTDYMMCKYKGTRAHRGLFGKIQLTVSAVFVLLLLSTPLTNFSFTVDEFNCYHRGVGAYLAPAVAWLFIAIVSVRFGIRAFRSNGLEDKEAFSTIIQFLIPSLVATLIQMLIFGTSILQIGFMVSLLLVFISSQKGQISLDDLTGLNNRHELDKYLEKCYSYSDEDTFCICVIDADNFKQINDLYGHIEGDKALKVISMALKESCNSINKHWFLSRFGGDEFIIVGTNYTEKDALDLEILIRTKLDGVNEMVNKDYEIGVSFGYSIGPLRGKNDYEKHLVNADRMMYTDKRTKKKLKKQQEEAAKKITEGR